MIDLHSHILPGIDDGAQTLVDSINLIEQSISNGVSKILATPHIHLGTFDNDLAGIESVFKSVSDKIESLSLPIQLGFAAEVRICPEIMLLAKTKKLPFLGNVDGMDILLLEFPHSHISAGSDKLVDWLISNNIRPMIAHPERNRDLWKHSHFIDAFIQQGCLLQLTASSLVGDFGERSQALAWEYLDSDLVHIIASDMHSIKRRPNKMDEAYNLIEIKYGTERADTLCVDNPNTIFMSNPSIIDFEGHL